MKRSNDLPQHFVDGGVQPGPREGWWKIPLGEMGVAGWLDAPPCWWHPVEPGDYTVTFAQGMRLNFGPDGSEAAVSYAVLYGDKWPVSAPKVERQ